uniref:Retrovirus-related Pol polyprotein from transposon TNT 1-94 n=1 Tax=Tanacetum cinerariifolium TaxID=118510 RepID=A0A6L2LWR9_TANCI|nr:hypothetical protein [Tanacetum cinerariifolium]
MDEDPNGTLVDPTRYRGMVRSLMYLTASRLDLVFAVCVCARYQLLQMLTMQVAKNQDVVHQIPLYSDSKSAIALSCNTVQHSRMKHTTVRYHFIKEQVENEVVELYFVKTDYQLANIFTKALVRERFEFLVNRLGEGKVFDEMFVKTLVKLKDSRLKDHKDEDLKSKPSQNEQAHGMIKPREPTHHELVSQAQPNHLGRSVKANRPTLVGHQGSIEPRLEFNMLRTNSQAKIISKEKLVPRANKLVIKKNNQRVSSDSHITGTMLRFVVEILRHHKLDNLVSLTTTVPIIYLHQFWTTTSHNKNNHTFTFELDNHTFTLTPGLLKTVLQMPLPDPNNTYIQPPSEIKILEFIKTLGYDEDPKTKLIAISKMVATRLHQPWRAILNFASLIWDEFKWQIVKRSSKPSKMSKLSYTRFTKLIIDHYLSLNKSIPRRSDSKLHSSQDDHPITKLLNTTNGDYKFGMEVPDSIFSDAIKKKAWYKYYIAKQLESEKDKIVDEPEKQHVSLIKSGRGKDMYNEWGQKLKGPAVEDLTLQSLLNLRKGLKASRLESLRQQKQPVAEEGLSAAHNKYYSSSDTDSDATLYSSSLDKQEGSAN